MREKLFVFLQSLLPQHLLSQLAGWVANSRNHWIKNRFIHWFMERYQIDLSEAVIEAPEAYATFNDFFTRALKPETRPIAADSNAIACPVDGTIAQIGYVHENHLLQVKDHYFNLEALLGGDNQLAEAFYDGAFATFYLAPNNYHRIHMPLKGRLTKTLFIPGKLFSVNRITTDLVPDLYARNERLVTVFDTAAGPMAVILVGAMIVGSMQTNWMQRPIKSRQIQINTPNRTIELEKGAELGQFKLGSTVICLFGKDKIEWIENASFHQPVKFGQNLGNLIK